MKRLSRVSIAAACALGMSAAAAQSVQRGDKVVSADGASARTVAQARATAPTQVAQAGGSSTGASTAGATATVGVGPSLLLLGAAVATIAVTVNGSSTVQH